MQPRTAEGNLVDDVAALEHLGAMDADEKDIITFLKQWGSQFVSGREICRRAGGKHRFRDDPYWANQPLLRLVERAILETDSAGHFRLIEENRKRRAQKKWIAPHLRKILEQSGKDFGGALDAGEPDASDSQSV